MDIEKRLKDHLIESGGRIKVEMMDPAEITNGGPARSGWIVQSLAAVLVLAMAGVGFLVASGDGDQVTEIAAGEGTDDEVDAEAAEDTAEGVGDGDADSGIALAGQHRRLELIDLTSDLSPGSGGTLAIDNGVYYLLATAPGRVTFPNNAGPEAEAAFYELLRPRSFYTFEQGAGWAVNTVEDRFVSDFDVKDGVLYVVSTGSKTRDQASFGTSTDRGRSWTWQDVDGLTSASQVSVLAMDQPLVFASRWGFADLDQARTLAASAGLDIPSIALYDVNGVSITYSPIPTEDRCKAVYAHLIPSLNEMTRYFEAAAESPEFEDMSEAERDEVLAQERGWITDEVSRNGCEMPEDISSTRWSSYVLPDPVTVTWDELGVAVPEEWSAWAGNFVFDGDRLVERELPFGDGLQVSYHTKQAGRLNVGVFDPAAQAELYAGAQQEAEAEAEAHYEETFWHTTDGVEWTKESYRYGPEEEDGYYESGGPFGANPLYHLPPTVGDKSFRLWWNEPEYEEQMQAIEAAGGTDGEIEQAMAELYVEPMPELQRKVGTGAWETITFEDLNTGVDVGDRALRDVRGSSLGVFLVFGPPFLQDGPPADGQTVVYSGDGAQWDSFEVGGQGLHYFNNGDNVLMFVEDWAGEEGERSNTESYLVRPAQ